jgi:hypothetical protein
MVRCETPATLALRALSVSVGHFSLPCRLQTRRGVGPAGEPCGRIGEPDLRQPSRRPGRPQSPGGSHASARQDHGGTGERRPRRDRRLAGRLRQDVFARMSSPGRGAPPSRRASNRAGTTKKRAQRRRLAPARPWRRAARVSARARGAPDPDAPSRPQKASFRASWMLRGR